MTAQNPKVTAADREAYLAINNQPEPERSRILAGEWDQISTLQLLARHRELGAAEEKARLQKALTPKIKGSARITVDWAAGNE